MATHTMSKHERKTRLDAQGDEWKRNLDLMKAKAEAATGGAKVSYKKTVADLTKQYDEFKIKAAKAWDSADDTSEKTSRDLDLTWDEWELRARKALNDLNK